MDNLTPAQRRKNMVGIRSRHTSPERIVRSLLHSMGLRFRLHDRRLPGTPDVVLRSRLTVVQVFGCFWHRHPGCPRAPAPSTHRAFWTDKFRKNCARDAASIRALKAAGWRVIIVWECETRTTSLPRLASRLRRSFARRTR